MNARESIPVCTRPSWGRFGMLASISFLVFSSTMLSGDVLRLPNGEVLVGKVLDRNASVIVFDSQMLGRVSVPAAGVEIQSSESVVAEKTQVKPQSVQPAAAAMANRPQPEPSWIRKQFGLPAAFGGNIDVGVDMLNADQEVRNYRVEAGFSWKTETNEFATYHAYESMRVNNVQATKTHDEGLRWIRHLPPRWMLLGQVDWRSDENQGVDYRVDAVFVPSFYFWKADRFQLLGGVGMSHEWRRWMFVNTELDSHFNYAAYQVMRFKLTPTLSLRETLLAYMDVDDTDNRRSVFDVTLRQRLSAGLSLMLNFNNRYESNPAPRTVKRQERLMTKLGYEF